MVIEDLDASSPQNQDQSPYSDELTSSSSGTNSSGAYTTFRIRTECIVRPDPFTLYFGFFGHSLWHHKFAYRLQERIRNHAILTHRVPQQNEIDALTEHTSRDVYYSRIGLPYGASAVTAYYYYRARQGKLFPLVAARKETSTGSPRQLLESLKSYAVRNPLAFRIMAVNVSLRSFFLTLAASALSSGYALMTDLTHTMADPRLEDLRRSLKNMSPEERARRKAEARQALYGPLSRSQWQIVEEGQEDRLEEQLGLQQSALAENQDQHSYSELETIPSEATTSYPDSYSPRPSQDQPRSLPDRGNRRMFGAPGGNEEVSSSNDGQFDILDDASPTTPEHRDSHAAGRQSGSVWDRIRQRNMAGPSRSSQQDGTQDRYSGPQDTSRGFDERAARDRDRQQAQADFDKLIESERSTPDDVSGPGSQNNPWGSWSR